MLILQLIQRYKNTLPKRLPKVEKTLFDNSILEFERRHNIKITNIRHYIYMMIAGLNCHPVCDICGNPRKWNISKKRYNVTCSVKCANKQKDCWSKRTTKQRAKIVEKRKHTNITKYGHTNYLASEEGKKITREVFHERYGVVNPSQLIQVQDIKRKNSMIRHGVEYPSQSQQVKDKIKATNHKNWDRDSWSQRNMSKEVLSKLNDSAYLTDQHINKQVSIPTLAKRLDVWDTTVVSYLKKHKIKIMRYYSSLGQVEVVDFLRSVGIDNIRINTRSVIYPYELDIYLPDYKIAIEYNGLFWHSEIFKSDEYHVNKTKKCEDNNIRLIQIFDDEWQTQQDKCKATLLHIFHKSVPGTFARNTSIKEIPWNIAKEFLDEHHLLNAGSCGNYRIGAFDKETNILIGVMVFGRQTNEHSQNNVIELKRFVTNKKNNPGLGSKMFKYAVREQQYRSVVAFVDRRWFTGLVKDHIGFTRVHETAPAIWWTNGKQRFHRRFITKKQLISFYDYNSNVTKRSMLKHLGFVRIYDCGKIKLIWNC